MKDKTIFTYSEVLKASMAYFKGDDMAATTWINKYCLKKGDQYYELTPDDMHKRMAKEFGRVNLAYAKLDTASLRSKLSVYGAKRNRLTEGSIYNLFKNFDYVIPQGSVMSQLGSTDYGSLSNCFVIGQPEDSYGGIFQKEEEMVQLMKNRGGVGIDISTLRPNGATTTNAAQSSTGACSFMHRFSNGTREVAQNGRRGALMLSMDVRHPDIMEFIKMKRDLTQVTGANISIKLNEGFMEAVAKDKDYILRFPCDARVNVNDADAVFKYRKNIGPLTLVTIKAKEYWNEIIKSAHSVAEPGLMFWDNMVNYSPDGVYDQYRQVTTNPCSEIAMQEYDACRLIAVNLFTFVDNPFTTKAKFNYEKFFSYNYEAMVLSDLLIDLELEKVNRIIKKIKVDKENKATKQTELNLWLKIKEVAQSSRRTGLGFTALGDTLAALGLKYDSIKAKNVVSKIMDQKMRSELDCTIDLAVSRGTFKGSDPKLEDNAFYDYIKEKHPDQMVRMIKYGRRNVSWSTVAPTGSLSMLAQVTSGIEPLFQGFYTRRRKINAANLSIKADFIDDNGDKWEEFQVLHPKFKDWLMIYSETAEKFRDKYINSLSEESLQIAFNKSPWAGATANEIDWKKRVQLQGLIQKSISHSISSTINLPSTVSEAEVDEIYMDSWKEGLKGITVYRDGSRSGVLITKQQFEYKDAVKRPKTLPAEAHVIKVGKDSIQVYVGLLDGKPYELFAYYNEGIGVKGLGTLTRLRRTEYEFTHDGKDLTKLVTDIMTDEQSGITRLISTGLRHGADIKHIVEQLRKSSGSMFSYNSAIARVLKKYIPDGTETGVKCLDENCKSTNVIFEEGCHKCLDCGNTKCG